MSILSFDNVSYQYPSEDFDIIDQLSFSVEPGSFHCIIGISGCGKSTIFRMTNGLLQPKAGNICVNENPITGQNHYCGYMPQKDMLFPWRTIGENLALTLEIQRKYSKAEQLEMIDAALADVGLDGCRDKRPDELSGGMRQRAAFARTMLTGSDLLLLDEPFSAQDFLTRISMQEWLLDQWQRHKKTILFITHDVEEAVFIMMKRILSILLVCVLLLCGCSTNNNNGNSNELKELGDCPKIEKKWRRKYRLVIVYI